MSETWDVAAPGVMRLPSGRLIRGRGLRDGREYAPDPQFAVYLLGSAPYGVPWEFRLVEWPDFGLPADASGAREAFIAARQRAATERVEVGCAGGRGRTGTALACIAILDGVPAAEAVAYVREHYSPAAVETPAQEAFVARFS